MRIVDIRERAIPLKSDLKNSSFDFSEMTTSVVAVRTDVRREGQPVTGFAFNSTGRYACGGAMRARFIPRILAADPQSLLDETQENLDPSRILIPGLFLKESCWSMVRSGAGSVPEPSATPTSGFPQIARAHSHTSRFEAKQEVHDGCPQSI